jgi:hypothetical protein
LTRLSRWYAFLALTSVIAFLAACGGNGNDSPSELTGLIVDVRGRGGDVSSFTLQTGDQTYEIHMATDVNYGFTPAHLRAHASALFPVRCKVERRRGRLFAVEIVDA